MLSFIAPNELTSVFSIRVLVVNSSFKIRAEAHILIIYPLRTTYYTSTHSPKRLLILLFCFTARQPFSHKNDLSFIPQYNHNSKPNVYAKHTISKPASTTSINLMI